MKIKSVNSYKKNLSLHKPYTIAYQTVSEVENIFFEIELENGIVGMGAANPSPEVVGEGPDETLQYLQSTFVQSFAGKDIRHFNQLIDETKTHFPNLPGTQAAIDIALHDAFGKFLQVPIVEFYGQKIKSLPTSVTIGIKNTTETLEEASEYYKMGFKIVKVKMGLNLEEDIERIIKIHENFEGKLTIRVDANQGYTLAQLQQFIASTKNCGVELIEQPLPVGSENGLLDIEPDTRKYFAADESLKDAHKALTLSCSPQPFGIFNIKLMKCGGIKNAFEIANIAHHAGIQLFWGCNDESIISITAAMHTAFACSNTKYIDLDGSFDLSEDIVSGGFILENGYMRPNGLPGLGIVKTN